MSAAGAFKLLNGRSMALQLIVPGYCSAESLLHYGSSMAVSYQYSAGGAVPSTSQQHPPPLSSKPIDKHITQSVVLSVSSPVVNLPCVWCCCIHQLPWCNMALQPLDRCNKSTDVLPSLQLTVMVCLMLHYVACRWRAMAPITPTCVTPRSQFGSLQHKSASLWTGASND
jgi:hypothetical protein